MNFMSQEDYDARTCRFCGEISHPGATRKSDGVRMRAVHICTRCHRIMCSLRNGGVDYNLLVANNAGFKTVAEYNSANTNILSSENLIVKIMMEV